MKRGRRLVLPNGRVVSAAGARRENSRGSKSHLDTGPSHETLRDSSHGSGELFLLPEETNDLIPKSTRELQTTARLNSFTINRLNFDQVGLVGRDEELEILKGKFQETCLREEQGRRGFVVVSGSSGVGKSTFVNEIRADVKRARGSFVLGKFDLQKMDKPYAGILSALGEICQIFLQLPRRMEDNFNPNSLLERSASSSNLRFSLSATFVRGLYLEDVANRLREELGSDLDALMKLIPALRTLAERPYVEELNDGENGEDSEWGDHSDRMMPLTNRVPSTESNTRRSRQKPGFRKSLMRNRQSLMMTQPSDISDQRSVMSNRRSVMSNRRSIMSISNRRSIMLSRKSVMSNRKSVMSNRKSTFSNRQSIMSRTSISTRFTTIRQRSLRSLAKGSSGDLVGNISSGSIMTANSRATPILGQSGERQKRRLSLSERSDRRERPSFKESSEQLKYSLRRLTQVMSSIAPLVLVIDDCQWADMPSLELLKSWATDSYGGNILIVACYRSDHVNELHTITGIVEEIQLYHEEEANMDSFSFCEIKLENLSVDKVERLVSEVLTMDASSVRELASVIHEKTHGNAFFVVQLMMALRDNEHLKFNLGTLKWMWNIDIIREVYRSTANVGDLMQTKFESNPAARKILPVAACLGSTFKLPFLEAVLEGLWDMDTADEPGESIEQLVEECSREGFIRAGISDSFSFVHDKVEEAALSFKSAGELRKLRINVGNILLDRYTVDELEDFVFPVANLLSLQDDEVLDDERRMTIASFIFQAGEKALERAAFASSSKYLQKAIDMLPETIWELDEFLAVDIFSTAATAEYCKGNFKLAEEYCDRVLNREEIDIIDRLEIGQIKMDIHEVQSKSLENVELGLQLLKLLGCTFPKKQPAIALTTLSGLLRVKRRVKKLTTRDINELPILEDEAAIVTMTLLDKFVSAVWSGRPELVPLVICKMNDQTAMFGLAPYASVAYGLLGVIFAGVLEDFESATNCGVMALSVLNRCGYVLEKSRSLMLIWASIMHWNTPLRNCLRHLKDGYVAGMETGTLEAAFWCIFAWLEFHLLAGMDLDTLDSDFTTYSRQMRDFSNEKLTKAIRVPWQTVKILRGSKCAMTDDEMSNLYDSSEKAMQASVRRTQVYNAFFLGQHEKASKLALEWSDQCFKLCPAQAANVELPFAGGISCSIMARKTGKRKYKRHAMKCLKRLSQWCAKGNPNCVAQKALLEAEMWVTKKHDYGEHFELAVLVAGRNGLKHIQAMANERYAVYLYEFGDVIQLEDATYRLEEAIRLYHEWGALVKVQELNSLRCRWLGMPKTAKAPMIGTIPEANRGPRILTISNDVQIMGC